MPGWQEVIVLLIVVVSGLYVARRAWSVLAKGRKAGCSSGSCSRCESTAPRSLVQLDLRRPRDRSSSDSGPRSG